MTDRFYPGQPAAEYIARLNTLYLVSIGQARNEIPAGVIDGVNAVFVLAHAPTAGSVRLYLGGIRQRSGIDFAVVGNTITYAGGAQPRNGDNHVVDYEF